MVGVGADLGGAAGRHGAAQGAGHFGSLVVGGTECEVHAVAPQHFGHHHRGDAHGCHGLLGTVGLEDGVGHAVDHRHARAVEGIGGEVARCAHAAGQRQSVEVGGAVGVEREQVAPCYACAFGEDVALFHIHQRALLFIVGHFDVWHHFKQPFGGEALVGPAAAVDGQHEREAFLQFASVAVAAAAQYDCYFFHLVGVVGSMAVAVAEPVSPPGGTVCF